MKKIIQITALLLFTSYSIVRAQKTNVQKFLIPSGINIRSMHVVDDNTVWFSGSNGGWGYTTDAGKTFVLDSVTVEGIKPEFRGISVTPNGTVFLMGIASPGYIFRSIDHGKTWTTVYENKHRDWFMDSMVFTSDKDGWVLGDYCDGCMVLLHTEDGGESWNRVDCNTLPRLDEGEAFYASSNSCLAIEGNRIVIASGGTKARVFISEDKGQTWRIRDTPILQGGKMTGTYSVALKGKKIALVGGDYDKKEIHSKTKAISTDGGITWKLMADGRGPAFGSCVQFGPNLDEKAMAVAALPGVFISKDSGKTWFKKSDDSFYTCRFSPSGSIIWFAGAKGELGKLLLEK